MAVLLRRANRVTWIPCFSFSPENRTRHFMQFVSKETICINCPTRQLAWNVKPFFLGKIRKYNQLLVCWICLGFLLANSEGPDQTVCAKVPFWVTRLNFFCYVREKKRHLTLSAPNFRLHLSSVLFFINKLSIGKKSICKTEILNVEQRRPGRDRSFWAVLSGSTLFAKACCCRLWQWKGYDMKHLVTPRFPYVLAYMWRSWTDGPNPDQTVRVHRLIWVCIQDLLRRSIRWSFWDNFSYFSIKTYVVGTH